MSDRDGTQLPLTTLDRVRAAVSANLGKPLDLVEEYSRLVEDLGADSLDTIAIGIQLELEFGITLPDDLAEDARKLRVSDLVVAVDTVLRAAAIEAAAVRGPLVAGERAASPDAEEQA